MTEMLSAKQPYQLDNFGEPLSYALDNFDSRQHSRNRKMGGKALASLGELSYAEEEPVDPRRALQESMDLRD